MSKIATLLGAAALTVVSFGSAHAADTAADNYPNRPITVIIPFAPGGTTDTLGRLLINSLSEKLGQPMVIENTSGAGGLIGMQKLQKANADGYTLVFNNMSLAILPSQHPKAGYDPLKEIIPIGIVASVPMVLSVSNKSGIQDLPSMLKHMRDKTAAPLNIGTAGPGSTTHLAADMFRALSKGSGEVIGYRGSGPALADLMSGTVDAVIDQTVTMLPLHADNRVKAIAVTSAQRLPQRPDLPTFSEGGLPEFDLKIWNGLVAPVGTPQAIVDKLAPALSAAIDAPAVKNRLESLAAQAPSAQERGSAPFRTLLARDIERVSSLLKAATTN